MSDFKPSWVGSVPRWDLPSWGARCTWCLRGKRAYPFHAHHVIEELFVVLSGEGEYRFGDRTFPSRQEMCSVRGRQAAHQLVNTGHRSCAISACRRW